MKVLMIVSHPNLNNSIANRTIVEHIKSSVDNLEVRHIEALYPDFKIDVEAEQQALLSADIIILQHPFYWYSTPAGLKQWMDVVLGYGFAFGHDGDKLKGKHFIQSLTVGGPEESYKATGYNHFTIEELLRPMEQTVYLTQMVHHGFIHTHRNAYIAGAYNSQREVQANGLAQAERLVDFIEERRAGDIPKIRAFIDKWFAGFDALDEHSFFTQYLADDIKMQMVGAEPINNVEAFNTWYDGARRMFKAPTEHIIYNLNISPDTKENNYHITFDVILNAVMSEDLSKAIINAKERWLLAWDAQSNRPTIKEYDVWLTEEDLKGAAQ